MKALRDESLIQMVMINLELPEEIEEKARAAGLLTSEKLAVLIEAELERQKQENWAALFTVMGELQGAAREELDALPDDEFTGMVNEIVREVRQNDDPANE